MTISAIGVFTQNVFQITSEETNLSNLLQQEETGYTTQDYGTLGNQAGAQVIYTNAASSIDTYNSNITTAQSRISVSDDCYTEISNIVNGLSSQVTELYAASAPYTASTTATLNSSAKSALDEINGLLNTNLNGRYLFAGSAASIEPMVADNTVNTAFLASGNGVASGLPANYTSAATSYADVCSYFQTVSNYYSGATNGVEHSIQTTATTSVQYGSSADNTSLQTVLRAVYAAANLQPTTVGTATANQSEFQNYLSDINSDLTTGMSGGTVTNAATNPSTGTSTTVVGLNTIQGIQGDLYTHLSDIASQNSTTQQYLSQNLGNIQDANMATVSEQIINLQTQLQASFKAISIISSLSLVTYI